MMPFSPWAVASASDSVSFLSQAVPFELWAGNQPHVMRSKNNLRLLTMFEVRLF